MLRKLRIRDFKVFHDQEFEFKPGTTAIIGPNGSGKTTILEAIEFALFRSVTRKEKEIKKVEEVIRHTADKATIELEFEAPINGKLYKVDRRINPGATNADLFLKESGDLVVSDPKRVDKEIIKLLGVDKNAFSALAYVRQGEILKLSRDTPSKRQSGLYSMMGLGIYDKKKEELHKDNLKKGKSLEDILAKKKHLEDIRKHLPKKQEVESALSVLGKMEEELGKRTEFEQLRTIIHQINESVELVETELTSENLVKRPQELEEEIAIADHLESILEAIPSIAESQLRPYIRTEARAIFQEIFGDRYSDLVIDDKYEISLYDLQGNKVPLKAASGGEDVCVNFALRVAVNTALQKYSSTGPPPGLIILDEPGAGLDKERRKWLPEAIAGLDVVNQVIVVTHMDEFKEATNELIELIPQGKGRQPIVEVQSSVSLKT
ncbi:MAG: hypothetical protein E4H14_16290 [Candidatus Thorarchaeota archaeon]|nr:MAG: hypothetical protein E4H14_16290 [Candidatus Thorarchaeota archaeon]